VTEGARAGGRPRRLVIAITGSTGAIYGVRLLERLRAHGGFERHLVLSAPAKRTLAEETDFSVKDVEALADVVHDNRDIGASIASGSFRTEGMVVVPCSIKTASAIATGHTDTLIARAGDVTLKEGRPLIVVVRETPLHLGHLRLLVALAEMGAVILRLLPPSADGGRRRRSHRGADPRPPRRRARPRAGMDGARAGLTRA
jgi:4-hydroxy-3-polyprenylbenzoate decarboxylase